MDGRAESMRVLCKLAQRGFQLVSVTGADLHDRAELFGEERLARRDLDLRAHAAREAHLGERREETAVAAIVVREEDAAERLDSGEEFLQELRIVDVGRRVTERAE